MVRSLLTVALPATLGIVFGAQTVRADLTLCNDTGNRVGIAIGYHNTTDWVSEGWWNVPERSCQTVLQGDLTARYYYFHAIDYDEDRTWYGDARLCTSEREFIIIGRNKCIARGFSETGFREIDTGEARDWTERLTSETAYLNQP